MAAVPLTGGLPAAATLSHLLPVSGQRRAAMAAGATELASWLEDLLAEGLGAGRVADAAAWATAEARLVDAQLPGLATRLHALSPPRPLTDASVLGPLLAGLGELYGLTKALRHFDQLTEVARLEVWQQAGVTIRQEALLAAGPSVADEWQVLTETLEHQNGLTLRQNWLYGRRSGRHAQLLHYFRVYEPAQLTPNRTYTGAVVYYPGLLPLRVVPGPLAEAGAETTAPIAQGIGAMLAGYAGALGCLPWLRRWPVTLAGVVPAHLPDGRYAVHAPAEGQALPLCWPATSQAAGAFYDFVVQSNAQLVTVFGEWDGQCLLLHRTWAAETGPAPHPALVVDSADYFADNHPLLPEAAGAAPGLATAGPAWGEPWPTLLGSAVPGTRLAPGPLPVLPGPPPQGTPAQQLLQAASTAALLQKAGFQPPTDARPLLPFPPETRAVLGPAVAACLRQLLLDGTFDFANLAPPYLARLRASGRVLPPALLMPLLASNWVQTLPANTLNYPNSELLGRRGAWLSQQRESWRVRLGPEPAPTAPPSWELAAGEPVAAYITHLRGTDPAAARQLLAAHLRTLNQHHQATVLAALALNLTAADEPLLTAFLASPTDSVLEAVVPLLVQLPGSALLERLWQRALPLLSFARLGQGPPALAVQLPTWNPGWRADGLVASAKRSKADKAANLLHRLLALLPPSRWVAHLGVTAAGLLAAATAHEQARLLLPGWVEACVLHHDLPFATALLRAHAEHPGTIFFNYWTLDPVFTTGQRLALLQALPVPDAAYSPVLLGYLLPNLEAPWPLELTDLVLSQLTAIDSPNAALHPWVEGTLKALPAGVADDRLPAALAALRVLVPPPAPHDYALRRALRGLELRLQMRASLRELEAS